MDCLRYVSATQAYDDNSTPFTGTSVDAVFTVFPVNSPSTTVTQKLHKVSAFVDGGIAVAYTDHLSELMEQDAPFWLQMSGVVDKLMAPRNGYDDDWLYESPFNSYWEASDPGYPGYLSDQSKADKLLDDLALLETRNFYFFGHGNAKKIGVGSASRVELMAEDVAARLGNVWSVRDGIAAQHPYRFVFLDACNTATTKEWQRAFGFFYPPYSTTRNWNSDRPPRAFLGWAGLATGAGSEFASETSCTDYGTTLNLFFHLWMSGFTLDYCIQAASSDSYGGIVLYLPLPVPGSKEPVTLSDGSPPDWARPPYNHKRGKAPLKVVGYRGLTRTGYAPNY